MKRQTTSPSSSLEEAKVPIDLECDLTSEPCDSSSQGTDFKVTYLIILIHGIGVLLPWNMFLTASGYFENQFDKKLPEGEKFARYFTSSLAVAGSLPNLLVQAINFYARPSTGTLTKAIYFAITSEQCIFVVTIVIALFSWTQYPTTFFCLTIISVILINLINGLYQNSVYGIVALLPSAFMNACIIGMNISGTVTSIVMILSLAISSNEKTAAIVYFASAILFLTLCTASFIYLRRMRFFRFYWNRARAQPVSPAVSGAPSLSLQQLRDTLLLAKGQCFNVFYCMFISLSLFPVVLQNIQSPDGILGPYFSVVYVFLIFNLFAVIGNVSVDWLPRIPADKLWIFVCTRTLFIPYFLLCNFQPGHVRAYAPLFYDETFLLVGNMLLGFSSGFASSLAMTYAVQSVQQDSISTAGMLSSFALISGIFVGVCASFLLPMLV